jgi:hypothetical protein
MARTCSNEQGGTVLAATNPKVIEFSQFVELERFENKGLISLQDGQVGDVFRITSSYKTYGGTTFAGRRSCLTARASRSLPSTRS